MTDPAAANKFIEETKDKAELSTRVGELRNGYQALRASCEGSEQGCDAVNALKPQLDACTRMNEEACDALESAMNDLK